MRAPYHNFVVITPMVMKFGGNIKIDVFYTIEANYLPHHYINPSVTKSICTHIGYQGGGGGRADNPRYLMTPLT